MIVRCCKFSGIELKIFGVEDSYVNFEAIIVLNSFNITQRNMFERNIERDKVFKVLKISGKYVKKLLEGI